MFPSRLSYYSLRLHLPYTRVMEKPHRIYFYLMRAYIHLTQRTRKALIYPNPLYSRDILSSSLKKTLIGPSSSSLILGQTPKLPDTNYQHKKSGNDQRSRNGSDLSILLSERWPWVWISILEDCSFHWQSWLLRRVDAGPYL